MAYEHERISGNRIEPGRAPRSDSSGTGGVILVLGGAVLAVLLAMFLLGGRSDEPSVTDQPLVIQPEVTAPAPPAGNVAPAQPDAVAPAAPEAAPAAPDAGTAPADDPAAPSPAPAPAD